MARAAWLLVCWALTGPAFADPSCRTGIFENVPFSACVIDPTEDRIELFHSDPSNVLIGSFGALSTMVEDASQELLLAMNGGMYHADRRPVGLYIEDGQQRSKIVLSDGPGNFGLLPNGVFCLKGSTAKVSESRAFDKANTTCDFATQSGPMLVIGGTLHPRFIPNSPSRHVRNGVGVRDDGTVVFAISDAPVNFHRFARLFRDELGTPNALFLDGSISRIYAPMIGRTDVGLPLGPILGVVTD